MYTPVATGRPVCSPCRPDLGLEAVLFDAARDVLPQHAELLERLEVQGLLLAELLRDLSTVEH